MNSFDLQTASDLHANSTPILYKVRVSLARQLDRWADAELQHGHHHAAEQFARKAAEMREAAR